MVNAEREQAVPTWLVSIYIKNSKVLKVQSQCNSHLVQRGRGFGALNEQLQRCDAPIRLRQVWGRGVVIYLW